MMKQKMQISEERRTRMLLKTDELRDFLKSIIATFPLDEKISFLQNIYSIICGNVPEWGKVEAKKHRHVLTYNNQRGGFGEESTIYSLARILAMQAEFYEI
jgi:hypothetical protein